MSGGVDVYFVATKADVDMMEKASWRRVLAPHEAQGVDFFFDRETAIGLAREMSRVDLAAPVWAVRARLQVEAVGKWRASDAFAVRLGGADLGTFFVSVKRLNEFSADLAEPIEVLGGFA